MRMPYLYQNLLAGLLTGGQFSMSQEKMVFSN